MTKNVSQPDQTRKADKGKPRPSLLYVGLVIVLRQITAVLSYGAIKYEANSWQNVDKDRYWVAFYRHLDDFHLGETRDQESNLHHLAHAACNLLFLLWFETKDNWRDFLTYNEPPTEHKQK